MVETYGINLFKTSQYPIVETWRLLLRFLTLDDTEAMFEYASDKKNRRFSWTKIKL